MKTLGGFLAATVLVSGIALAGPESRPGFLGWGPRCGLTFNPDQVHFGGHLDFGNFGRHIRLQPNLEIGFGDDVTVATANLEIAYRLNPQWNAWTPFLGVGPAFAYYRVDSKGDDDTESESGLNIVAGLDRGFSKGSRFFLEATIGVGDIPDFKLTTGWTFAPKD